MNLLRYLVILLTVIGCTTPKEHPLVVESIEFYKSTISIEEGVVNKIKTMNTLLDSLEEGDRLKDSLSVLKQDFIDWEANLVEIPGYESDDHDHHDHGHDHDHSPSVDLTPEMMLEVQKELNNSIILLNERADLMMDSFSKKTKTQKE